MNQKQHNQKELKKEQQDLIDLPEDIPEKPWKQYILAPKFILLLGMALFFIGKNIYEYLGYQIEIAQQQKKMTLNPQMNEEIYNRFFWYVIMTGVFIVVFILLRRSNDRAQQIKVREQVKNQVDEQKISKQNQEKDKKIQQKGNKIIMSMDQFGNLIDQSQLKQKKECLKQKKYENNQNQGNRKESKEKDENEKEQEKQQKETEMQQKRSQENKKCKQC